MQYIGELQAKKLLDIKVIKNDKNIMEEFIYLDFFYEKISLSIVGQSVEEDKSVDTEDIFAILEKELGKQLSPIEIEIVKAWKGYNYSDEMIKAAIKEATTNGVTSLKYIDKVLYAWNKKGLNNKSEKFEQKDKKVDVFDYDWMDDDE